MAIQYFGSDTDKYPQQTLAIFAALKTYISQQLYFNDTLVVAKSRFVLADMNEEASIREATKQFGTNQKYPFTAYSVGDQEPVTDRRNSLAKSGRYYSALHNCYIDTRPLKQTFPMFSFFNNVHDFETAKKIFQDISDTSIKLYPDITVNGISTQFVAEIKFVDVNKGGLAYELIEYLNKNKIFDLSHTVDVYYHDVIVNSIVNPVDTIEVNYDFMSPIDDSLGIQFGSGIAQATPILSSSVPENWETDVPVNNTILLTFNVGMNETSVENNLDIEPYIEHDLTWSDDSTTLLISPHFNMTSGVHHIVTVEEDAFSWYSEENLESGIAFGFTTAI